MNPDIHPPPSKVQHPNAHWLVTQSEGTVSGVSIKLVSQWRGVWTSWGRDVLGGLRVPHQLQVVTSHNSPVTFADQPQSSIESLITPTCFLSWSHDHQPTPTLRHTQALSLLLHSKYSPLCILQFSNSYIPFKYKEDIHDPYSIHILVT